MRTHLVRVADEPNTRVSDLLLFLGPGLLTTEGAQHRRQRKMLNPVFSAAHLRHMTHIFYDIAHKVRTCHLLG